MYVFNNSDVQTKWL